MSICKVTIRGTRPLLMHNGQLKDPLNEWAKKLKYSTSKKDKSDEDHAVLARLEFEGSMYFDEKLGPYIPTDMLQACMISGARKHKRGAQFEALVEVLPLVESDGYALEYSGPRDVEGLWSRPDFRLRKSASLNGKAVMRTRPRFAAGWRCTFDVEILESGVNVDMVREAFDDAGKLCGLGDWTPRYGRFVVEKFVP